MREETVIVRCKKDYLRLLHDKRKGKDLFFLVVTSGERIQGFMVAARPLGYEFHSGAAPLLVNQYGGLRKAIFQALCKAFSVLEEPFGFSIRADDRSLLELAEGAFRFEKRPVCTPLKVINPRLLWRDLAGEKAPWPPTFGERICRLRDWTYFFFGRPGEPPLTRFLWDAPLPFPVVGIDESIIPIGRMDSKV